MKLGLKAPEPGQVKLRLATYCNFRQLPSPPEEFGHYDLIPATSWGMLANDQVGDCAIAGGAHQTMLWTAEGEGVAAPFSDSTAIKNYSDITGYSPENPATDMGTGLRELADYWIKTGLVDDKGERHKVVAVVDLNPGDLRELWVATYLFQSVGLGFMLPESAIEQTQSGQVWDVVRGAEVVGGHYVPCFGRSNDMGIGVSWGTVQPFTERFYTHFNNQGICAMSEEMLINAKSIDGFDDKLLRADLEIIGQ